MRKPHTCPKNLDVARDASIITKAKAGALLNPLISARTVVEKEVMAEYDKDPSRDLPLVANIIRAVQRAKQPKYPKKRFRKIAESTAVSNSSKLTRFCTLSKALTSAARFGHPRVGQCLCNMRGPTITLRVLIII
jgi:hypothetical protein